MELEGIKSKVDELGAAWSAFQEKNDARLAEIEKKGSADPLLVEQVKKINDELSAVSEQKARLEKLEAAVARPGAAKDGESKEQAEYKQAFAQYLRKGYEPKMEGKDLSVNSDPDGGYLVTPEIGDVVNTRVFESTPMRQLATVQTISTDALEFPLDNDEAGAGWVQEEGTRSTTDTPTLDKKRIVAEEMYAKPRATQKLLDDASVNIEQWIAGKIAERFARLEATAFVTGDGVGKPRGITTYAAWAQAGVYESGKIEQINSGTSGAVTADGLIKLVYGLKSEYRGNANFMAARGTIEDMRLLKDGESNYLWRPGLELGQPDRLLGYPVIEGNDMPAVGADALAIAFADFRRTYMIVDRLGIRTLRDPFSAKPYVEFYTTKRVGGDVVNFDSIKLMKLAN